MTKVSFATILGGLVMVVALSVMFGQVFAPTFAAFFGVSVLEAAFGWLVVGGTMMIVGIIQESR